MLNSRKIPLYRTRALSVKVYKKEKSCLFNMIVPPPSFYFSCSQIVMLFTFAFSFTSSLSPLFFPLIPFLLPVSILLLKRDNGEKGELKTHPNTRFLCTGLELNEYIFHFFKKRYESPFLLAGTWGNLPSCRMSSELCKII